MGVVIDPFVRIRLLKGYFAVEMSASFYSKDTLREFHVM